MTTSLTDKLEALDSSADFSDPNVYADLLGYDEPVEQPAQENKGDTAPPAEAAAPAAAPVAQAEGSATPAAAPAQEQGETTDRVDGILTRDGKNVIPYAVLEGTRSKVRELEAQLAEALKAAKPIQGEDANADLEQRAAQGLLTEEERLDFPALAKIEKALVETLAKASSPAPTPAAPAAAPAPTQQSQLSEDEQFDLGIAANPLLAGWMNKGGKEWQRAVAIDQVLQHDSDLAGLTYAERFAKVEAMVAAEFGIQRQPKADPTPRQEGNKPGPAKPAANPVDIPPTLTDFSGAAPVADPMAQMPVGRMVDTAMGMSVEQLRSMVGLSY